MKNLLLFVCLFQALLSSGLAECQTQDPNQTKSASLMNPATSLNILSLYKRSRQSSKFNESIHDNGLSLQEVELQFSADVDPYFRVDAALSVHPDENHYAIEPEEVYAKTTSIPYITFKLGRFHAALGRHNEFHTHAFPFIDAPLINQRLLGADGLTEVALSTAVLIPTPWFMELTLQILQGESSDIFASTDSSLAYVTRLRNLFDLTDDFTMDLGISGAKGKNAYDQTSKASGFDLTFKWRPNFGGKYTALIVGTEFLQGEVLGRKNDEKPRGDSVYAQYQFAERWWIEARTEQTRNRENSDETQKKTSVLLAFFPSEFSGIRADVDLLKDNNNQKRLSYILQGNFTIGAHPAHSY